MTWLNALPSVPVVGVQFEHRFVVASDVVKPLGSFLDKLQTKYESLTIGSPNPWDVDVDAPDGFTFRFHREGIVIGFSYERGARVGRGQNGLPALLVADPRAYTELLDQVLGYTEEVIGTMSGRQANVTRFGLVASTPMDRAKSPPGVMRLLAALDAVPGTGQAIRSSCRLFSRVAPGDGFDDRCHYNVTSKDSTSKNEEAKQETELSLDYQRYFAPPQRLDTGATPRKLRAFAEVAMEHFEAFGSGL